MKHILDSYKKTKMIQIKVKLLQYLGTKPIIYPSF